MGTFCEDVLKSSKSLKYINDLLTNSIIVLWQRPLMDKNTKDSEIANNFKANTSDDISRINVTQLSGIQLDPLMESGTGVKVRSVSSCFVSFLVR